MPPTAPVSPAELHTMADAFDRLKVSADAATASIAEYVIALAPLDSADAHDPTDPHDLAGKGAAAHAAARELASMDAATFERRYPPVPPAE